MEPTTERYRAARDLLRDLSQDYGKAVAEFSWPDFGYEPSAETALAILRHARQNLAPYQRIRRIEFYPLPKTISGKIRRVDLRRREEDPAARQGDITEWRDDQFPELRG